MKTTILENLAILREAIQASPDDLIQINMYRSACGTHYCTLGIATTLPHFANQGITLVPYRICEEIVGYIPLLNGVEVSGEQRRMWDPFFGPHAWSRLFSSRGQSRYDTEGGSDKDVALHRIDCQINRQKQLPSK